MNDLLQREAGAPGEILMSLRSVGWSLAEIRVSSAASVFPYAGCFFEIADNSDVSDRSGCAAKPYGSAPSTEIGASELLRRFLVRPSGMLLSDSSFLYPL